MWCHWEVCFKFSPMCCLCLWSTGRPLHCSSASSSPVDSPYPPPSHAANQSQGRLLGNSGAQAGRDSESEDEFGPNSFLVKTGSGNVCAPVTATLNGESLSISLPATWVLSSSAGPAVELVEVATGLNIHFLDILGSGGGQMLAGTFLTKACWEEKLLAGVQRVSFFFLIVCGELQFRAAENSRNNFLWMVLLNSVNLDKLKWKWFSV